MGGEMSSFVANSSGVTESTSTALNNFNSGFARASIELSTSAEYLEGAIASGQTDVWMHFDFVGGDVQLGNHKIWSWMNASGTEYVRIMHAESTTTLTLEYWNGSAWTSAGTTICTMWGLGGFRQTIDVHAVCNTASGSLKFYIAGTKLIDSGTIDLSGLTSLKNFRFFGATASPGNDEAYVSQVICADEPTVGMRLATRYVNGVGASTDWTGSSTDIDETVYEDADFILSGTNDQVSTFAQTGPSMTGYVVRAVGVSARAKCGASGPQHLELALRSAGTTYFSSSLALDAGYVAYQNIWETDPATSAAWVNTAVSSLQPGVKSIA